MSADPPPSTSRPAPPAPSRAIARHRRKAVVLIACSVVLAGLLLMVVSRLDAPHAGDETAGEQDVIEVFSPDALTPEEMAAAGGGSPDAESVGEIAEGWIQITNSEGQLAQQYRFEHLDPSPEGMAPGWFRMERPQFEVYMSGDRVLRLTGDTAIVYRPNRFIESGELTGNVVIRQYEDVHDRVLDNERDQPSLAVRTSNAQFDNILGEVRADDEIVMETRGGEFRGRELKILLNDQEGVIKLLQVETVHFIRLAAEAQSIEPAPAPDTPDADVEPERRRRDGRERRRPRRDKPREADADTYYCLTLHDNVRIEQAARRVTGDALNAYFSFDSKGLGPVLTLGPPPPPRSPRSRTVTVLPALGPVRPELVAMWSALGSTGGSSDLEIAPPPDPERDAIVRCDGRLTMVPTQTHDLASADHARLEIVGTPVRLTDDESETAATCDRLQYLSPEGRVELLDSDTHPLHIENPQLRADGEVFWLSRNADEGGFRGPGALELRPDEVELDADGASSEPLRITWTDRVDLGFLRGEGDDEPSGLRSAAFHGDVVVEADDLEIPNVTAAGDANDDTTDDAVELRSGRLMSETFTVHLVDDGERSTRVEQLVASGGVTLTDQTQTLWSESVDVTLRPGVESGETELDRLVAVDDVQVRLADGQRVLADRMEIDGQARTAVITGEDVRLLDGNSIVDRATSVTINEAEARYRLAGRGRFRQFDGALVTDETGRLTQAQFDLPESLREELRVTWDDGLEIAPRETTAVAERTRAAFAGNIAVISPEFRLLHADAMDVDLIRRTNATGPSDGNTTLDAIHARGDVRIESVGDPGTIACNQLEVTASSDADGNTVPQRFRATGAVHVADDEQDMWADDLIVTFRPRAIDPNEAAADPNEDAADGIADRFAGARVEPDQVIADGAIQMRLPRGERVFARHIEASVPDETARVSGPDLLVLGDTFALENVAQLDVDRRSGSFRVDGPGSFAAFADPVIADVTSRAQLARPALATRRTMTATWTTGARYEEPSSGRGTLTIVGAVRAESRPDALEINTVEAEQITVDFVERHDASAAEDERAIARMTASGDAKLESRLWQGADHRDTPRVLFVSGPHIEYDAQTLEALVDGAGELLIREPGEPGATPEPGRFGAEGTTLFRWQERLAMTHEVDNLYRIALHGDATVIHKDLTGRTSTVTGQWLETTVARRAVEAEDREQRALNVGGSMKPVRVYGRGGIAVRTAERDVTCDEFDYNPQTGIAKISAAPGRMVSILSEGSARPFRAQSVLWNMTPGPTESITVVGGGGAAGTP